mgnify:CR=1 FL=1
MLSESPKTSPALKVGTVETTLRKEISGGYGQRLAGIDEVGRGPLAGPVVASAVVCSRAESLPADIGDSKKLTAAKRKKISAILLEDHHIDAGFGIVSASEIDQVNVLQATHEAMRRAVNDLKQPCDFALVDGLPVKNLPVPSEAIVKGDSKSWLIAAASILAKVKRDTMMEELDEFFPEYGFPFHKGYGTQQHLDAIRTHGVTSVHRKSFKPVKEALGGSKGAVQPGLNLQTSS